MILDERQQGLSRAQLLNSFTVLAAAAAMMLVGLLLRNSALSATVPFVDERSGIRARIPANWLVTTDNPEYIMQAEDPGATPFKTTLRISVLPVGEEAAPRNVVDTLTLQRAGRLSTYRVLSTQIITFGESEALELNYTYVQAENNPFLSAVSVVVRGRDVVVIRGLQAIVMTYLEESSRFEQHEFIFDQFLDTLEF